MSRSMPLAFSQHKEVLSALQSNYASLDDVDRVIRVGEVQKDLVGICRQREASVADSVRALQQGVRAAEAAATPPEPEAAHAERVAALQTSLAHSREQVEALEQEGRRLKMEKSGLAGTQQQLEHQSEQLELATADTEPRLRHERTLFAHISQITWESHPRGHCKGAVSDVRSGDIRSFELDPAELSAFQLTNRLWDLMA